VLTTPTSEPSAQHDDKNGYLRANFGITLLLRCSFRVCLHVDHASDSRITSKKCLRKDRRYLFAFGVVFLTSQNHPIARFEATLFPRASIPEDRRLQSGCESDYSIQRVNASRFPFNTSASTGMVLRSTHRRVHFSIGVHTGEMERSWFSTSISVSCPRFKVHVACESHDLPVKERPMASTRTCIGRDMDKLNIVSGIGMRSRNRPLCESLTMGIPVHLSWCALISARYRISQTITRPAAPLHSCSSESPARGRCPYGQPLRAAAQPPRGLGRVHLRLRRQILALRIIHSCCAIKPGCAFDVSSNLHSRMQRRMDGSARLNLMLRAEQIAFAPCISKTVPFN